MTHRGGTTAAHSGTPAGQSYAGFRLSRCEPRYCSVAEALRSAIVVFHGRMRADECVRLRADGDDHGQVRHGVREESLCCDRSYRYDRWNPESIRG